MSLYGNNPCRDCEERHEGCHGKCERYLGWRDEVNKKKDHIYRSRKGEVLATSFTIEEIYKGIDKRKNKRRGQF